MKSRKLLKNFQSTRIFNGKKKAEEILLDLKKRISQEKIKPKLAVILVGENKPSKLYIKLKQQAAEKIGIELFVYKFKTTDKEKKVLEKINQLNNDFLINGIIVQMPLPREFNAKIILKKIDFKKDVDGFHEKTVFCPPLISAILISLKDSKSISRKNKIIALVNSDFFGKFLQKFLKEKNILIEYFLRKKLKKKDLIRKTKQADVIISVCGVANLINHDMIKKNVVLIDGGIVWPFSKKVTGDIDQKTVKDKACFLTPVPGGLGPLTVALLLKNTYLSFKKYGKHCSRER